MEIQARRFGDKFLPGQLKVLWFISAIITELFIFLNLKQVSHFYVEFGIRSAYTNSGRQIVNNFFLEY